MIQKLVEVDCYRLDLVRRDELVQTFEKLVQELKAAEAEGYVLEGNPFDGLLDPTKKLVFRFLQNPDLVSKEQLLAECKIGLNPAVLSRSIEELELSTRAYNMLCKNQIRTVRDLVKLTLLDVLRLGGSGKKTAQELEGVVKNLNLELGMKLSD